MMQIHSEATFHGPSLEASKPIGPRLGGGGGGGMQACNQMRKLRFYLDWTNIFISWKMRLLINSWECLEILRHLRDNMQKREKGFDKSFQIE